MQASAEYAPRPRALTPRPSRHATLSREGKGKQSRSRGALRARVLQQERKPLLFRLQINKGRRSAGRRKRNRPHHTNRCRHPSALRARRAPRTIRLHEPPASGALAFRRSTAALARLLPLAFDFRPGFLECAGANGSTLPDASAASTSRTGHSAGRDDARSRPGAVCETARGNRTRSTFRIASRKRPC